MSISDDIVKSLRNPTPLYAVAGTADLAAEKLREVPALIGKLREQAPEHIEKIKTTDPKVVQDRVSAGAKDAQAKLAETYREIDLKAFKDRPDFKKLSESVQDLALQSVGRATGYAVKARETYDVLAERGKGAVASWRGETADQVVEIAAAVEPGKSAQPKAKPAAARKAPARGAAAPRKSVKADKPAE
ncbi:hypothetical protein [Streptomyces sp. NBC_01198]|uniref:hypothetical protein n=1 Tax=Streptomyces sp. NBC_01198 TaxID=2903769 RepID=UPI002E0DD628|nr:hypothetical protein OG702_15770 [Streptomyces sp. NBC_01198]